MVSGRSFPPEARRIVYNVAKYLKDQKVKFNLTYNVVVSTSEATGVSTGLVKKILKEFASEDKQQNKRRVRDKDSLVQENWTEIAQKQTHASAVNLLASAQSVSRHDPETWLPEQKAADALLEERKSLDEEEFVTIKAEPSPDMKVKPEPEEMSYGERVKAEMLNDESSFPLRFVDPENMSSEGDGNDDDDEEGNTTSEENEGKLTRHEESWKRHVTKKKRNLGEEYVSASGKVIPKRVLLPPCADKCRLKCTSNLSEEQRHSIHNEFWKLGDITLQREFIVNHSIAICPKYRYKIESSTRKKNLAYYFDVDGKRTRVCKNMFLATLSVGHNYVATAWSKKMEDGTVKGDLRGKHSKKKKVAMSSETEAFLAFRVASTPLYAMA